MKEQQVKRPGKYNVTSCRFVCVCVLGAVASVKDEVVREEKGVKGLLSLCIKVLESRGECWELQNY